MLHLHRHISLQSIRRMAQIDVRKWFRWDKQTLTLGLLYCAMLIAVLGSMNVSLLWALKEWYVILSAGMCCAAALISNSQTETIFGRKDFLLPLGCAAIVLYYIQLSTGGSVIAMIMCVFHIIIFYTILRLNIRYIAQLCQFITKAIAVLIGISVFFFILYLLGFNLPHHSGSFWLYDFDVYPFFLLDDRNLFLIFPRFHAFFLEPGHMGTVLVLLLATQKGMWKRWYNIILLIALLLSFSLAAYGLLAITVVLHMWMDRKHVLGKLLIFAAIIAAAVGFSFVYNQGDNMLNQAIVMRLEVNETGDGIEGNNRVTAWFEAEFDSFLHSGDILFGRDMPKDEFGNAGYRVYIYEHGFVGFILTYLFYFLAMFKGSDKRAFIAMMVLSLANFWIRAYPMHYAFFLPYYFMAYMPLNKPGK